MTSDKSLLYSSLQILRGDGGLTRLCNTSLLMLTSTDWKTPLTGSGSARHAGVPVMKYLNLPMENTMKLSTLVDSIAALGALAQIKLPAKTAYRIAKNLTAVQAEAKVFDEQRNRLLVTLGTPRDGDPNTYDFAPDDAESYRKQLTELLDEDVDITLLTVTPDDLGDATIEPSVLMALDGVIIVG